MIGVHSACIFNIFPPHRRHLHCMHASKDPPCCIAVFLIGFVLAFLSLFCLPPCFCRPLFLNHKSMLVSSASSFFVSLFVEPFAFVLSGSSNLSLKFALIVRATAAVHIPIQSRHQSISK
ncbi:hypothetical protein ABW21_db0207282 [Orbilia brochopaga]|nr:hypothetical protein ABW21_db0207282 [Drechslerella brochopaga]